MESSEVSLSLSLSEFESKLLRILGSSFPDINYIRSECLAAGYVPYQARGKVWSLLLNDSYLEDDEASVWHSSREELHRIQPLLRDCELITKSHGFDYLAQDILDLVSLFCIRRNVKYHSILTSIVLLLLAPPMKLTRSVASTCFYSLCTNFFPIPQLIPMNQSALFLSQLSHLFRMLLCYHHPSLALHLDGVYPNWEYLAEYDTQSTNSSRNPILTNENLDGMERYIDPTVRSASDDRDPPQQRNSGIVTADMICTIFNGCLPFAQTIILWDWAILTGERYAGLYLAVSLLGLYEATLLAMDGSSIRKWSRQLTDKETWWNPLLTEAGVDPMSIVSPHPKSMNQNCVREDHVAVGSQSAEEEEDEGDEDYYERGHDGCSPERDMLNLVKLAEISAPPSSAHKNTPNIDHHTPSTSTSTSPLNMNHNDEHIMRRTSNSRNNHNVSSLDVFLSLGENDTQHSCTSSTKSWNGDGNVGLNVNNAPTNENEYLPGFSPSKQEDECSEADRDGNANDAFYVRNSNRSATDAVDPVLTSSQDRSVDRDHSTVPQSKTPESSGSGSVVNQSTGSMDTTAMFVHGWILATALLIQRTPTQYRNNLNDMLSWIANKDKDVSMTESQRTVGSHDKTEWPEKAGSGSGSGSRDAGSLGQSSSWNDSNGYKTAGGSAGGTEGTGTSYHSWMRGVGRGLLKAVSESVTPTTKTQDTHAVRPVEPVNLLDSERRACLLVQAAEVSRVCQQRIHRRA